MDSLIQPPSTICCKCGRELLRHEQLMGQCDTECGDEADTHYEREISLEESRIANIEGNEWDCI